MQYTLPTDNMASDMMWDAGRGGGGPYVHCSCGINHHEDDSIEVFEYIELDNKVFVYECAGCEAKLRQYEDFIWNNRSTIREYLRIRVVQEKAWADQEKTLNIIAGI